MGQKPQLASFRFSDTPHKLYKNDQTSHRQLMGVLLNKHCHNTQESKHLFSSIKKYLILIYADAYLQK